MNRGYFIFTFLLLSFSLKSQTFIKVYHQNTLDSINIVDFQDYEESITDSVILLKINTIEPTAIQIFFRKKDQSFKFIRLKTDYGKETLRIKFVNDVPVCLDTSKFEKRYYFFTSLVRDADSSLEYNSFVNTSKTYIQNHRDFLALFLFHKYLIHYTPLERELYSSILFSVDSLMKYPISNQIKTMLNSLKLLKEQRVHYINDAFIDFKYYHDSFVEKNTNNIKDELFLLLISYPEGDWCIETRNHLKQLYLKDSVPFLCFNVILPHELPKIKKIEANYPWKECYDTLGNNSPVSLGYDVRGFPFTYPTLFVFKNKKLIEKLGGRASILELKSLKF